MVKKAKPKVNNKLKMAYERMLDRVKLQVDTLEHQTVPEALEHAKQTAIQLGEVTRSEAELLVDFLQRDLSDAAQYLDDTGHNLTRWLKFDMGLIEQQLWDTFSRVADKTRVDKLKFDFRLQRGPVYRCGEITGPGTLQCDQCGELVHFHMVSPIPSCAECGGHDFSRVAD